VPGIPRVLSLDFDLQKSNTVDMTVSPPEVTVEPVLYAEVDRESDKPQRLRGPLQSVNVNNGTFHLFIHPFHARLVTGARPFGSVNVHTDENTYFEIDGQAYIGAEGLAVLALEPKFTGVVVRGFYRLKPKRFEATEVYAGSSVPGGEMDVVTGSVVARNADTLTLRGVTVQRSDGVVVFNDTVTVTVDDSTRVRKAASVEDYTQLDISVGQQSPAEDADPANYELNVGTLDVSPVEVGSAVHARGFVTPFGSAPKDFDATSVAWKPGLVIQPAPKDFDATSVAWKPGLVIQP